MTHLTLPVILDYCGGKQTDDLFERISDGNKDYVVEILDNASPRDVSRNVTARNSTNSFVGGGIRDCLSLAEQRGAEFLFFMANDIKLVRTPSIGHFESLALSDPAIVVVGASVTSRSEQGICYPWMINLGYKADRVVPHYDLLCCLVRLDFIRSFGGFPPSKGGWGYDWEMACYARYRDKKIVVTDTCLIHHPGDRQASKEALGMSFSKETEMMQVYNRLYGDYRLLYGWRIPSLLPELDALFSIDAKRCEAAGRMRSEEVVNVVKKIEKELKELEPTYFPGSAEMPV